MEERWITMKRKNKNWNFLTYVTKSTLDVQKSQTLILESQILNKIKVFFSLI